MVNFVILISSTRSGEVLYFLNVLADSVAELGVTNSAGPETLTLAPGMVCMVLYGISNWSALFTSSLVFLQELTPAMARADNKNTTVFFMP
jgi:hypothetical protein